MTASELHRKLLFCGYDDLTAYFKNNPVNRYVHTQLLALCQKYKIKTPLLVLFNEIYYLCLKIQCDRRPGEALRSRYLVEEENWLKSNDAAMLVLAMVWALIQSKRKPLFNDECFLMQFTPILKTSPFIIAANDVIGFMNKQGYHLPQSYLTLSAPVNEIPKDVYVTNENPWRTVTENLSISAIEWFITLYHNAESQLNIYERIYEAFTIDERNANSAILRQMRVDIENNNYLPGTKYYGQIHPEVSETYMSDDKLDNKPSNGLARAAEEELGEKVTKDQLVKERDEAIKKCEEQKKSHELDVARLEAQIAELKQQLERNPKPAKTAVKENPTDNVIPITVEEMVAFVKKEFSETSAVEFSLMLYRLADAKNYHNKEFSALINGIGDAIKQRDALHKTYNINDPKQVNISSEVENKYHTIDPLNI